MQNIVEIKSGNWTATINILKGANCISLKNDLYNANILREQPLINKIDNPYVYGMPILFPVNRIEGGTFTFEGRKYFCMVK